MLYYNSHYDDSIGFPTLIILLACGVYRGMDMVILKAELIVMHISCNLTLK